MDDIKRLLSKKTSFSSYRVYSTDFTTVFGCTFASLFEVSTSLPLGPMGTYGDCRPNSKYPKFRKDTHRYSCKVASKTGLDGCAPARCIDRYLLANSSAHVQRKQKHRSRMDYLSFLPSFTTCTVVALSGIMVRPGVNQVVNI